MQNGLIIVLLNPFLVILRAWYNRPIKLQWWFWQNSLHIFIRFPFGPMLFGQCCDGNQKEAPLNGKFTTFSFAHSPRAIAFHGLAVRLRIGHKTEQKA